MSDWAAMPARATCWLRRECQSFRCSAVIRWCMSWSRVRANIRSFFCSFPLFSAKRSECYGDHDANSLAAERGEHAERTKHAECTPSVRATRALAATPPGGWLVYAHSAGALGLYHRVQYRECYSALGARHANPDRD